jgi:hypothetical protein
LATFDREFKVKKGLTTANSVTISGDGAALDAENVVSSFTQLNVASNAEFNHVHINGNVNITTGITFHDVFNDNLWTNTIGYSTSSFTPSPPTGYVISGTFPDISSITRHDGTVPAPNQIKMGGTQGRGFNAAYVNTTAVHFYRFQEGSTYGYPGSSPSNLPSGLQVGPSNTQYALVRVDSLVMSANGFTGNGVFFKGIDVASLEGNSAQDFIDRSDAAYTNAVAYYPTYTAQSYSNAVTYIDNTMGNVYSNAVTFSQNASNYSEGNVAAPQLSGAYPSLTVNMSQITNTFATGQVSGSYPGLEITGDQLSPGNRALSYGYMYQASANGSWTAPPTTTHAKVTIVAAGGGGAGGFRAEPTSDGVDGFVRAKGGGGGGGAGGWAQKIISVTGGSTYPFVIGVGGTGGNTNSDRGTTGWAAPGGTGGSTTFAPANATVTFTATGGEGGVNQPQPSTRTNPSPFGTPAIPYTWTDTEQYAGFGPTPAYPSYAFADTTLPFISTQNDRVNRSHNAFGGRGGTSPASPTKISSGGSTGGQGQLNPLGRYTQEVFAPMAGGGTSTRGNEWVLSGIGGSGKYGGRGGYGGWETEQSMYRSSPTNGDHPSIQHFQGFGDAIVGEDGQPGTIIIEYN